MSHFQHRQPFHSAPTSAHGSPQGNKQPPPLPPISTDARFTRPEVPSENGRRISEPTWATGAASPGGRQMPEPASARSLRMNSILNPSASAEAAAQAVHMSQREQGRPPAGSPSGPGAPVHSLPPMSEMPSPYPPGHRPSDVSEHPRRAFAPGTISLPQPGMDPRKSPFTSAANTPQIGTPNAIRSTYPFPPQSAASTERRGSDPIATAPQSQSNSPTTSYSSFGHTAKNSPASHYSQVAAHHHAGAGYGSHNAHHGHMAGESIYRSSGAGGNQGTYQMMTLDTDQGPIQVPVDVQAASKMADEKRKRNAGASARFRQRRKEKEREASTTISRLESQLRDIGDQKEYYRMERDYFRSLVYQSGVQIHVAPRLPSPKPGLSAGIACSNSNSTSSGEYQQSGERGSDDGRNQRRRISTYNEPGPAAPPAQGSAYPPPPATGPQYPQAPAYAYPRQEARPPMAAPSGPIPAPGHNQPPPPHYGAQSQPYDRAWKPHGH